MIDHTGLKVKDPKKSRQFYEKALAPLGYEVLMEIPKEYTGGMTVLGYGVKPSRIFGPRKAHPMSPAFTSPSGPILTLRSMRSIRRLSRRAEKTTVPRALALTITKTTTGPFCSIPTGITSRSCAIAKLSEPGLSFVYHLKYPFQSQNSARPPPY